MIFNQIQFIVIFITTYMTFNSFYLYVCSNFHIKKNNMKNVEVPKRETKVKRINVAITPIEHKTIMLYCKTRKVTLADLIRFALKQTFDL